MDPYNPTSTCLPPTATVLPLFYLTGLDLLPGRCLPPSTWFCPTMVMYQPLVAHFLILPATTNPTCCHPLLPAVSFLVRCDCHRYTGHGSCLPPCPARLDRYRLYSFFLLDGLFLSSFLALPTFCRYSARTLRGVGAGFRGCHVLARGSVLTAVLHL